jgi:hypothetical protein
MFALAQFPMQLLQSLTYNTSSIVVARVRITLIDVNTAVCTCPTIPTVAVILSYAICTGSTVVARVRITLINVDSAVSTFPTILTVAVILRYAFLHEVSTFHNECHNSNTSMYIG